MRRPMTTTTYYVGGAPIPDGAQVTVSIPQGARILEVRAIEGAPVLFFLADRDAPTVQRNLVRLRVENRDTVSLDVLDQLVPLPSNYRLLGSAFYFERLSVVDAVRVDLIKTQDAAGFADTVEDAPAGSPT